MFWNLTYADPDRWKEVYAISGQPLPWWKRSGSPRMRLTHGPQAIVELIAQTSDVKWANFQRTQAGGILYFRVRLEVYGIPLASGKTRWFVDAEGKPPQLVFQGNIGSIHLELTSAPTRGQLALFEKAFGPQIVSKVHT